RFRILSVKRSVGMSQIVVHVRMVVLSSACENNTRTSGGYTASNMKHLVFANAVEGQGWWSLILPRNAGLRPGESGKSLGRAGCGNRRSNPRLHPGLCLSNLGGSKSEK